jgi:hypothetical protein
MDNMLLNDREENKQSALHWDLTEWISEIGIRAYKVFEELMTEKEKLSKGVASLNTAEEGEG